MVNTRSKTGALKSEPGPQNAPTKRSSADRKKDSDHVQEPDTKRRRITDEETDLARDQTAREPADGTLEALPMDVVLEIMSHLHPLDLVQLARTSKIFRRLLMSKRSRNIWQRARSALNIDVPECPPDQSEPQWAILLFDPTCPMCNTLRSTKVEWTLRIRGCKNCLEEAVVFGSAIPHIYPGISMEKILDLLPFAYERRWSWLSTRSKQLPARTTKRTHRRYYRPAIQPMIDLFQSLQKQVLLKAPDAKEVFADFVAQRKQTVNAVFDSEESLRNWELDQRRLQNRRDLEESRKWRNLYRDELVAVGYDQNDANRASQQTPTATKLEDGWERNREFFERTASRITRARVFRSRSSAFHLLFTKFLAESDKVPPIRELWPSSSDIVDAIPLVKVILETSKEESYQVKLEKLLPGALDRWWEMRKENLVAKIFHFKPQESAEDDEPLGSDQDVPQEEKPVLPFASPYAEALGGPRLAILDLAKSVFACSCQSVGWLENCPVYWDESYVNHKCLRGRRPYQTLSSIGSPEMEFDALASKQVDSICAALSLDANRVRFTELDELDARFRCVNCPFRERPGIMNWRVAIKHQHNKGRASQRFLPTFVKIPDEEAAIVRTFELENPDMACPLGRIRSPLSDKAFHSINELQDYLKNNHNQNELAPDSYWIDPSVPPKPVLESDVFEE